ncbi:MAG: hypothetical protein SWX82_05400 [Cyanobacteriota bacterium]|nr:hypothetical protein [Cyanobacteriota bacterium]
MPFAPTPLLPYSPTPLLPYSPTPLLPYSCKGECHSPLLPYSPSNYTDATGFDIIPLKGEALNHNFSVKK